MISENEMRTLRETLDLAGFQRLAKVENHANGLLSVGDICASGEIKPFCAVEMALAVERKELFIQWAEIIWQTMRD